MHSLDRYLSRTLSQASNLKAAPALKDAAGLKETVGQDQANWQKTI